MKVIFGNQMGIGEKESINPSLPTFLVRDFPIPRKESTWNNFPESLVVQPEKLIPFQPKEYEDIFPPAIFRIDLPNYASWETMVKSAISSNIEKTVLARKTTFEFEEFIDPMKVVSHLKRQSNNALVFGFILSPTTAFVGATPELLIERKGRILRTEALAGTRLLSEEDQLLSSKKDLSEFKFVKNEITKKLQRIAKPFETDNQIRIKKTAKVCHLHYPFEVELNEGITDEWLLTHLHPTPALGGSPTNEALEQISKLEPFDRGWYAGTLGKVSNSHSEIYVGIRSAIIEENKVHLFSGAGIVQGSCPLREWQELEDKISLFGIMNDKPK